MRDCVHALASHDYFMNKSQANMLRARVRMHVASSFTATYVLARSDEISPHMHVHVVMHVVI